MSRASPLSVGIWRVASGSRYARFAVNGLYDPSYEHDACGLGFVADLTREASQDVVTSGLEILARLAHRGAAGSDPETGDGAGILTQIPHAYFERVLAKEDKELPLPGDYGVAQVFLSRDKDRAEQQMRLFEHIVRHHNQKVVGWRDVPVSTRVLGPVALRTMPLVRQLFVARMCDKPAFERTLFLIRRRTRKLIAQRGMADDFYIVSFSSQTIVYKGLMLPERVSAFYKDLKADDFRSRLSLVHSRFSTNTFPSWERAHPYRRMAHNGEINTLRGNMNWMAAREALLAAPAFGEHLQDFKPIIKAGGSDSQSLDNVVDFLLASGRSLPHVMMMLVPEAWSENEEMSAKKRAFYEYHAALVEPWDGPAALAFTDGTLIGATLDRNGLRPAKYVVTKSGRVILASELGVLTIDPQDVSEKGRLAPGKMFLVDTDEGRIVSDREVKDGVVAQKPYELWLRSNKIELAQLPENSGPSAIPALPPERREQLVRAFGYTTEDLRVVLANMAESGEEPVGSMGADIALAVLSDRPVSFFRYFKQQFAQVTNPPIDPIREDLVMSLVGYLGGEGNLLDETPGQCRRLELAHPILLDSDLEKLRTADLADFPTVTLDATFDLALAEGAALEHAIERLGDEACSAVGKGASLLIISDRKVSALRGPVPSLLATSSVHHRLIREGLRAKAGVIVECGDAREVADVALLLGYGAGGVNPYLALACVGMLADKGMHGVTQTPYEATKRYVKAQNKGLLKVMSKMGISCMASYRGAQIFEALGINDELCARHFTGTSSAISGIGLLEIEREARARHTHGFGDALPDAELDPGGVYAWRAHGERHLWTPKSVASLQKAVRLSDASSYEEYAHAINDQNDAPCTLRGLWDFARTRPSILLDDVEPAKEIVKRFATGAMSFGSISKEAHENLAIAMNRIGGKSNTGEGGEDDARFIRDARGDSRRSAIKQIASGRFGVTSHYLVNADELQIKMAQGAKPGEGGQLPGHKVDAVIARVRYSTPGVTLISPPPHHDIYSIEDLAQLIFDLKNVSPRARISVKLVSESGVGTVAAGVAKAHADCILIAGHDGGTGASPLSSVQHAGTPWEIGLAEAQQVLVRNGLRGRVVLQADGQLKTGRDVAFAALLGAEEFGFATAPLVASGCIMMRKCHLNTCPVGVATQDPVLRARFTGTPEHVIRYFFFVAEELRAIMADLGFRTLRDMVGHVENVVARTDLAQAKARTLDFSRVLVAPPEGAVLSHESEQDHGLSAVADLDMIQRAQPALLRGEPVRIQHTITNKDRTFGAMLGGEISRRYGAKGLPEHTIGIELTGTGGQSFGAFLPRGVHLSLEGDANDYVGKGLSGGVLVVKPPSTAGFAADENVIVGNTVLYGATRGRAFFSGRAGERFCVRNSGAEAVVEGIGDHGCEYMTGGGVVVLGTTGRNFGAGMSGGLAFVLDEDGGFRSRCNMQMIELSILSVEEDMAFVRSLLEEHVEYTGSAKGAKVLASFSLHRSRFVKVFPLDYKRALEEEKARKGQGAHPHLRVV